MGSQSQLILICKPRLFWKLSSILAMCPAIIVSVYYTYVVISIFQSTQIIDFFALGLAFMFIILTVLFVLHYSPTFGIYSSGTSITRWKSTSFYRWHEIHFLWDNASHYNRSLTFGTKRFPYFSVLGWFYLTFCYQSLFSISYLAYDNYDAAAEILKSKLRQVYSYRTLYR